MTPLPLALLDQHLAIVGKTGSGKTFTAKGLIERLLDDPTRRVCVIDPTSVWWGLRASRDGKKPGYPVIVAGGEHGDVPLNERSGAALAGLIANSASPFVVDVSDFGMGERHRFMAEFAEALFRQNRRPLHLVIDEADEFAPQNPLPDTKVMLNRIDRIVRRGRVKGFRAVLITQRPAVLHKNVLTQANALIAMRLTGPWDRKAVEEWIKGNADLGQAKVVLDTLARLGQGEGWVWAPELGILERRTFPPIKTFDSSRAPEHGETIGDELRLANVDLDAVRGALAQAEQEAAANDPRVLKAKIAELERGAIVHAMHTTTLKEVTEAYDRGKSEGYAEALKAIGAMNKTLTIAVAALQNVQEDLGKAAAWQDRPARGPSSTIKPWPSKPVMTGSTPAARSTPSNGALPSSAKVMLDALASHYPTKLTWGQTATLAGISPRGGYFNSGRRALRDNGLIVEDGALVSASEAGRVLAGPVPAAPSDPTALLDLWKSKLPGLAPAVLDYLVRFEDFTDKSTIASHLGKASHGGYWNSAISTLRNNGLIEERGNAIRAADVFRNTP